MADFTGLIYEIEARVSEAERNLRERGFMLDACRHLPPLLPPQAAEWLCVARAFVAGEASAEELTRTRVEAWGFLGSRSCDFSDPSVNAVRAVICLLYPEPEGDWLDRINNFLEFCVEAGADPGLLHRRLRESFADAPD